MVMNKEALLRIIYKQPPPYSEKVTTALDEALGKLPHRLYFVIVKRFSYTPLSLKETGKVYPRYDGGEGVTPKRVMEQQAKALRMLRKILKERG